MKRILSMTLIAFAAIFSLNLLTTEIKAGTPDELETAKQISLGYLQSRAAQRGIANPDDLKVREVFIDDLKMAHTRITQTVNDVPVWGGEAIVHLNQDGSLFAITDDLKSRVYSNTEARFSGDEAITIARGMYRGAKYLTDEPTADLWIFRAKDGDHLAYRVQMRREDESAETAMPVYFIDAETGAYLFSYDNLQTATGSGSSLYSGTVSIFTYQSGSTYYLEDISRKVGTFDSRNSSSSVYRFTDTDNTWNTTSQRAGVDAHYGAEKVYDYYLNIHNRRGIDGSGGPGYYTSADGVTGLISSKVHYSSRYNNAFWNGSYMTYGDGDGTTFTPLVTLDIAGHEMTHGVTERTANLTYSNESGALNEAVSDIFGAMVERYTEGENANTWLIGEEAYTPATSGDALRYMNNPTRGNQPDYYPNRYTGSSDNGGVHTNSGIANYAFYLLSKGGTTSRGTSMTGIGADKAARIWYRALTSYMTSSTNFHGARTATINASNALYGAGSAESTAVGNSWTLVGVN